MPKVLIHIAGSRNSSGVESAMTVRLMRHTRSAVAMACTRSWVVMTRVVPSQASRQNSSVSISWVGMSTPVNGSSSNNTEGRVARARAMSTRCR